MSEYIPVAIMIVSIGFLLYAKGKEAWRLIIILVIAGLLNEVLKHIELYEYFRAGIIISFLIIAMSIRFKKPTK